MAVAVAYTHTLNHQESNPEVVNCAVLQKQSINASTIIENVK